MALIGVKKYFDAVIARAFTFSNDSAEVKIPLSGPTKNCPAASAKIGRRADPTPGSTTAT